MLRKLSLVLIFSLLLSGLGPVYAWAGRSAVHRDGQASGSILTFTDRHARAQFLVDNGLKLRDLRYHSLTGYYVTPEIPSQLRLVPGVKIRADHILRTMMTPNDPLFGQQYAMTNINAQAAWNVTTGSPSVIIADIDTGFAVKHQDLSNKWWTNSGEMGATATEGPTPNCVSMGLTPDKSCNNLDNDNDGYASDWRGWDFVDSSNDVSAGKTSPTSQDVSHGTYTSSLEAASTNDGVGLAGVCWTCQLMPLQALGDDGTGDTATIATAIHYAVDHGASVINMSLGSPTDDPTLHDAVNYALSHNVTVVAAAGNYGPGDVEYPAAYPGVIAVGATDSNNQFASFNSTGTPIAVVAPGVNVLSDAWSQTNQTTDTAIVSGTSISSAVVSGIVGLLKSAAPAASPAVIDQALRSGGTPVASGGQTYTLVNVLAALQSLSGAHPDGTLIQASGDVNVYYLQNGQRELVPSPAVFASWGFDWHKILPSNLADQALPAGNQLSLRDGSVVQTAGSSAIYVVDTSSGYVKHYIPNMSVFDALGYSQNSIQVVPPDALPGTNGTDVTASSHNDGTLVANGSTIYLISGGRRDYVPSPDVFTSQGFAWSAVLPATSYDLSLPAGGDVSLSIGSIVKLPGDSAIYVVALSGGSLVARHIASSQEFTSLGYTSYDIMTIPNGELPPQGPDI